MNTWHDGQFDDPVKNAQYQRRAKNQAHYAKKEAQRQFRKDFAPNAEEARFIKRFWQLVLGGLLAIGGIIYILPAWIVGVIGLSLVALVIVIAIAAGVKQGHGD